MVSLFQYPIHTFAFALFFIFLLYVNNIDEVLPSALILPVSISVVAIGIILILPRVLKKKFNKVSIYLSLVVVLIFSYGHVFLFVEDVDVAGNEIRHRHLLIVFGIIFVISVLIIKFKTHSKTTIPILNAVGLTVLASTMIMLPYSELFDQKSNINTLVEETLVFENQNRPDIYYIILDEYAGQETLKNYFEYDNSGFISSLETNGFHVLENSKSNYVVTAFAAPSAMEMEYAHKSGKYSDVSSVNTIISDSYQQNKVMNFFNQNDYKTVYIYGGIVEQIRISDENLCSDKAMNDFHTMLTQTTMFWVVQKLQFINNLNEIRFCAFDELELVGKNNSDPMFVFAHIKLPHDPFTIGANGETITPKKIDLGIGSAGNKSGYLNQLEFTNKKIIELVPNIIANSEIPPIIIIQSDHGVRFDITLISSNQETLTDEDIMTLQRGYNNFSAFYFPDRDYDEIYDDMTPINTFRIVFNKFFNADFQILDDEMYFQFRDDSERFSNVTDIVLSPKQKLS